MAELQKRFELQPHHVSWGLSVFFLLAAIALLLAGEIAFCAHVLVLSLLFSVAGRKRFGKLVPVFGLGLLMGYLLSPIANHRDFDEFQRIVLLAAGGVVGLVVGLLVDFLDTILRNSVQMDFDKRIICDEQP